MKAQCIKKISHSGRALGGKFVTVIHLNDEQEIKKVAHSAAKENKSGLCLRLICSDFSDPDRMNQAIAEILSSSELTENDIDLLVDIKETEKNGVKYAKYLNLSQGIPNLTKWRTFIFASGSFPENLSECKFDAENLIPRTDWKSWKEHIDGKKLKREPAFADYTIQHPIYKEISQFFHPTSSIKYTPKDEWLIRKSKKQKFELYLASAAELI